MINLRQWQKEALTKAINWLVKGKESKHFLINAAPGAGKTIAACAIAKQLIDSGEIDRVVVIAPRTEVVSQWAEDFNFITQRFMGKVTGRDEGLDSTHMDFCVTWAAVKSMAKCRKSAIITFF